MQVGLEGRLEVVEEALDRLEVEVVEEQGQRQAKVEEGELHQMEEEVGEEVHHHHLPPHPSSPRRPRGDRRSRYHR